MTRIIGKYLLVLLLLLPTTILFVGQRKLKLTEGVLFTSTWQRLNLKRCQKTYLVQVHTIHIAVKLRTFQLLLLVYTYFNTI